MAHAELDTLKWQIEGIDGIKGTLTLIGAGIFVILISASYYFLPAN